MTLFWLVVALAVIASVIGWGITIRDAMRQRRHDRELAESWRMIDQITEERRQRLAHLQHASKGFDAQRKSERMLGVLDRPLHMVKKNGRVN